MYYNFMVFLVCSIENKQLALLSCASNDCVNKQFCCMANVSRIFKLNNKYDIVKRANLFPLFFFFFPVMCVAARENRYVKSKKKRKRNCCISWYCNRGNQSDLILTKDGVMETLFFLFRLICFIGFLHATGRGCSKRGI